MCVSRHNVDIGGKVDWKSVLYCEGQLCDTMGTREREWDGKRPGSVTHMPKYTGRQLSGDRRQVTCLSIAVYSPVSSHQFPALGTITATGS